MEIRCTTATCVLLVWRYDLCSGSDHEICGRAGGGGASASAKFLRASGAALASSSTFWRDCGIASGCKEATLGGRRRISRFA